MQQKLNKLMKPCNKKFIFMGHAFKHSLNFVASHTCTYCFLFSLWNCISYTLI